MTFAEKLRQVRIGCHLTQEQVAELIGVTRKTIILYEAGERTPKQEKVYENLAQNFKTSVDFWKIDNKSDFETTATIAYGADGKQQAQKLLSDAAGLFAGGALSEEDKEAVFNALQKVYWEIKMEKAKNGNE
ncbi:helix-turn-helix transcriptional regulator [Ruminococcus flavefaciens]|uniref:helix-turn-helix transcriptional regulator n=1 Tax=Ruminococcus flavefaciens TaxID=1265 RepID=UPI00048E8CE5|nr:helix-turn-helix transcriptional regulator [Ruminococcus flavefaciens]